MNIGFDAKRAFHNGTGLGHYSRNLLSSLAEYYPSHQYFLFNPKPSTLYPLVEPNMHEIQPSSFISKILSSGWRSSWVKKDIKKLEIDLYHGLSHEIPLGISKTNVKSVVTIHDLIHERFPDQYTFADASIYRRKFRYACEKTDKVIAISEQTKTDIVKFYKIPEKKIQVCYQSCNPLFMESISEDEKSLVKETYELPDMFFLYVGSLIERKNLLNICKAMFLLRKDLDIPLVVIGDGGEYKKKVKDYLLQNGLDKKVIFLSEKVIYGKRDRSVKYNFKIAELREIEKQILDYGDRPDFPDELGHKRRKLFFQTEQYENWFSDFPAIYQLATAMIYPSFFEGFGIPVLEALWSKLPVITSNVSCLPEAGGNGAYYVNPASAEEIAEGMKRIYSDKQFADALIEKGWQHAQNFTPQKCAASVMDVYKKVW